MEQRRQGLRDQSQHDLKDHQRQHCRGEGEMPWNASQLVCVDAEEYVSRVDA